jgi:hypothetical protein
MDQSGKVIVSDIHLSFMRHGRTTSNLTGVGYHGRRYTLSRACSRIKSLAELTVVLPPPTPTFLVARRAVDDKKRRCVGCSSDEGGQRAVG